MENLSQNEQIRSHLEAGKTITPLEALSLFGCLRLGARIHNLKAMGLAVCSRLVEQNGKRFSEYSIDPSVSSVRQSECHAATRYEMTEKLMRSLKKGTAIAVITVSLFCSCATGKPGSASLHHSVRLFQETQQYQANISSGSDGLRMYRNQNRRPHKMTRIPFTQLYIF